MRYRKEYNERAYMVEWFKLYKKDIQNNKTLSYNGTFPFKSFSPQVIEFVFKLVDECGMDNTLKYKCVELYDKYLSEYFIHKYNTIYNKHPNQWINVLKQCRKQSYLRVVSCMQLISKYSRQSMRLKMKDIKSILKKTGHVYSKKKILSSEFEVFRTIGYKLSEPSIFMLVEYFIYMIPITMTDRVYSTCLLLTDFVYIYQQELYDHIQYQTTGNRNYTYIEKLEILDNEHKITTAAAVVITAFFILDSKSTKNEKLSEYLSTFCQKSVDYLYTISSVLVSIINSICIE